MFGSSSDRPRNWHGMDYSQQREWEDNQAKHQRALDDERYERERMERSAEDARISSRRRENAIREEAEMFADEARAASDQLNEVRSDLENITAERDGLCDLVRRFRAALDHYAKPDTGWDLVEHANLYEESKVLVPIEDGAEMA